MLNLKRGFVPAYFTLGVLLCALPASADTPAAPSASAAGAQTIVLQHVVPSDIVKMMHWDVASKLPAGVTQIASVPTQNALLVTASSAGLAQVREIAQLLDIVPRPVQIKFALASLSETELKASGLDFNFVPLTASDLHQGFVRYTGGPLAVRLLQTLVNKQAITEAPGITTNNNVTASVASSVISLPLFSQQITVTPRINADDSLTLNLHAAFSEGSGKREVSTLRTIKSGETLLLIMPPTSKSDQNLLLFVTPTLK